MGTIYRFVYGYLWYFLLIVACDLGGGLFIINLMIKAHFCLAGANLQSLQSVNALV